jgi:hypothetical protein
MLASIARHGDHDCQRPNQLTVSLGYPVAQSLKDVHLLALNANITVKATKEKVLQLLGRREILGVKRRHALSANF